MIIGDSAEQFSATELRRLNRRGWKLVNHLTPKGNADIDHLLVGTSGVLVVETKWRSHNWNLADPADPATLDAVRQVSDSANSVRLWLRADLGDVTPRAAVFAWGPQLSWDEEHPFERCEG